MKKSEFLTVINLLLLTIIAGNVLFNCTVGKEKHSPVTNTLEDTPHFIPVHHKEITEIKVELIGGY
ncbi:hypothetical protein F3J23_03855 [Chryseobacterium sp. Tr-659]|uniref:hypothetical protein n=1 Tax=Chryseobacterium sp. Tr-659 TaxID=2608340 RepID=UPI00141DD3E7|nr:hypothetical protein [Chryseobacterium sp. Tr-659]NIF04566.1 hypothetical protein [Chryseobacterium sp. Tr-659]